MFYARALRIQRGDIFALNLLRTHVSSTLQSYIIQSHFSCTSCSQYSVLLLWVSVSVLCVLCVALKFQVKLTRISCLGQ